MNSTSQSKSLSSPNAGLKLVATYNYVEDVLKSMLMDQSDHVYAKFSESYIKYRRVVVEWMVDVAEYFNLHLTTTHAAIAYLDRLQPNEKYSRFEWQMMAICCLIISSKYNECEEHVPPLHKLEEITQQAMSNECVLNYELWALKRMGWKLNARTPMAFLDSYMSLARCMPDASAEHMSCFSCPDFEASVARMATKCMIDHSFKALPASAIATGIIYFTREINMCEPLWTTALSRLTGHDAPTSKSVQRVLELLDVMVHKEDLAALQEQIDAQLVDSSLEESRDEVDELTAALDSVRVAGNSCSDIHADESLEESIGNESTECDDDENIRPVTTAATVASAPMFASATERVLALFGSGASNKLAAPVSHTTPANTVKTIGGMGGQVKDEFFSPVSIADFEA